jgi:hypothetical protein
MIYLKYETVLVKKFKVIKKSKNQHLNYRLRMPQWHYFKKNFRAAVTFNCKDSYIWEMSYWKHEEYSY